MTTVNKIAFILMFVLLGFTTMAYGGVHQPVIAIFYVGVALMMVLYAVDGFRSGTLRYSPSLLQLPLYATAFYSLVQIIPFGSIADVAGVTGIVRTISLDPFSTKLTAAHFFALAVFFSLSLILIDSAKRIQITVLFITVFGFAFAFFAILQSVLSPTLIYGIYETQFAQPFGSFVNRHNFAAYMEMCIAIPLGLLFTGVISKDKRLLYITGVALMGVALLLSGSRGGFVALVAQLIFLVLITVGNRSRKNYAVKFALAGVLIAAIVGGSFFVGGESSLTRISESATSKDVTTNRSHIWMVTAKVIAANLPFGAGFGAYGVAYTQYDTFSGLERVEQAHNDYLQVLADGGLVGLAIGGAFLFFLFQTGRKAVSVENFYRRGVAVGAASGIFAVLVHSIFDFVLHTTAISLMFILLLCLLVAAGIAYKDEIQTEMEKHKPLHKKRRSSTVTPFEQKALTEERS